MTASAKRNAQAAEQGLTLVELMIVVTVLALLTTTISLSVNRPRGEASVDHARFRAVHLRLREQAVMSRQILGLRVDQSGFQRMRWSGGDWLDDGAEVRWRGAVAVLVPFARVAPLQFAPTGEVTPLRLRFQGAAGPVICASDGWEAVTCGAG